MADIVEQLRGHLLDARFFARQLQELAAGSVAYDPDCLTQAKPLADKLSSFWKSHDAIIEMVWKLPPSVTDRLKKHNPVWQGMIAEAVAKIGDIVRPALPEAKCDDPAGALIRCSTRSLSDAMWKRIEQLHDADGELVRASVEVKKLASEGPTVQGRFEYRGKVGECQAQPWRLLEFMWGKQEADPQEAYRYAHDDHAKTGTESAIKTMVRKANIALEGACYPKRLSKPKNVRKIVWG